jgi:hypothetical protein
MLKLYSHIEGKLHYHEAWLNDGMITEHWGIVGERGQTREHQADKKKSKPDNIEAVLQPALDKGFLPIGLEDHITLLIEYKIDGMGAPEQLEKRHQLESRMDGTLGWTGLGACDGGSIGSGTMEVCCFVVDFDTAKRVIEEDLKGTEFSDYTRIFDENE